MMRSRTRGRALAEAEMGVVIGDEFGHRVGDGSVRVVGYEWGHGMMVDDVSEDRVVVGDVFGDEMVVEHVSGEGTRDEDGYEIGVEIGNMVEIVVGDAVREVVEVVIGDGVRERKEDVDLDMPFVPRIHTRPGPASKEHSTETSSSSDSEAPSTPVEES